MSRFFIPYHGEVPAELLINGHRVVLLAREAEQLQGDLLLMGADRLQLLDESEFDSEEKAVSHLAHKTQAQVVVTPSNVEIRDVIATLEKELPWIH